MRGHEDGDSSISSPEVGGGTPADFERGQIFRTFLIGDIRGYTSFTRERGAAAAARLAKAFADLARDAVEARGGHVFELRGDEVVAVFTDSTQAVRAAIELQQGCSEALAADPTLPLLAGIGLDAGDVVAVEDGYRGEALNVAARLCSNAAAGQVLMSVAVETSAREAHDLVLEGRGTATLKGFDKPTPFWEAFAVPPNPTPALTDEVRIGGGELDLQTDIPIVGREHEMRWARGTWRQVRRGQGRVVLASGPSQIGKTRFAAEVASYVEGSEGSVWYAGAGGTALADALAGIHRAADAVRPTLVILDDIGAAGADLAEAIIGSLDEIERRPAMMLLLPQDPDGSAALSALVERIDIRHDGHRRLLPLDQEGVREIGRTYLHDDVDLAPLESFFRSSSGVPGRVHEIVSLWAREEATRRLSAAAEWLVAGRERRAHDMEFANNVLGLKLDQLYRVADVQPDGALLDVCPYKGLATFEPEDAGYFFGRERLVGELAARSVDVGLLGVVGSSGSGKSSAVAAGLRPSLAAGLLPGSDRWQQVSIRPGQHPMNALRSALIEAPEPIATMLSRKPTGTRLVLVVDQFEEVFTTCDDEAERDEFIQALTRSAIDTPDDIVVVAILRADFYGDCAAYPDLARLLADNHVLVGPLSMDEMRRAIELPARRVGLRVESVLVDRLVADVADESGRLPLISTTLVELWEERTHGWLLTDAYDRTGGVHGAVARLAEGSYFELSDPEKEAAPGVFLRLVASGDGEAATKRRVPTVEFDLERSEPSANVISRFTHDRLLTADDGTVEVAHEALIREWPRLQGWLAEDVHGREIRAHATAAANAWEASGEEDSELYRGARLSATLDWASTHDDQLNDLERRFLIAGRRAGEREVERQRQTNRRLRGLLLGVATFLIVALVAGSLAVVQRSNASSQRASAEAQALKADAERIGAQALTETNLDRAMLMAVAGVKLDDDPQTRTSLLATLERSPTATHLIRPSVTSMAAIAVSPDGRILASADGANMLRFESLPSYTPDGDAMQLGDGSISSRAFAFTADGRTLISGVGPDLMAIDVADRSERTLASFRSGWNVEGAAFSPDGSEIAVGLSKWDPRSIGSYPNHFYGRLLLIDASDGHTLWQRRYPDQAGQAAFWIDFLPRRSRLLVTSAWNGDTYLWDSTEGHITQSFPVGGPFAVSPDGRFAAIAQNGGDGVNPKAEMDLLDLRSGEVRTLQGGLNAQISSMAFTPDGETIIGGSVSPADHQIHLWDVRSGWIVQTLASLSGTPNAIAITRQGRTLFSGVGDGSIESWDLVGTQRLGKTFTWSRLEAGCYSAPCVVVNDRGTLLAASHGNDGSTSLLDLRTLRSVGTLRPKGGAGGDAIAFFPGGRRVATGYYRKGKNGREKTNWVTVWDTRTLHAIYTLRLPGFPFSLAVSPDAKLLAVLSERVVRTVAGKDYLLRLQLWDVPKRKVLRTYLLGNQSWANDVAFSPDGRELVASGSDAKVWDVESGRELFDPGFDGNVGSIAFSPDGMLAVGSGDGQVRTMDARIGVLSGSSINASGDIAEISFSPDRQLVALSSLDGTASLWDLSSGQRVGTFPNDLTGPAAIFTPKGDLVVAYEGHASLWPVDIQSWEDYACQIAGRDFTPDDWSQLLPGRPYERVCPSNQSD